MESKGNIVFLGMMGSGKSSIGNLVSKKLNLEFFDVDKHIEKKIQMEISEIFVRKGEKFFREIEEKITLNILKKKKSVISLGGGAFLNKKIREEILKNHSSFWLYWDAKILFDRIKGNPKRPLTINLTENEFFKINKKRSNFYSKALYKISCNNLKKNKIVEKILNIYENN